MAADIEETGEEMADTATDNTTKSTKRKKSVLLTKDGITTLKKYAARRMRTIT